MAEALTFMMGKFAAILPTDRRYCRNHMWMQSAEGRQRFGFTSYAIRLMQDVYFLDWSASDGTETKLKQPIGHIETSKAMSDLFAPCDGTIVRFNPELLADPSAINVDGYGAGWLFEMETAGDGSLSVEEYLAFLDAGWEKTQNMLKGHM